MRRAEVVVDASRDGFADFMDFEQFFHGSTSQAFDRAEAFCEEIGDRGANVTDRKCCQQTSHASLFTGFDTFDQLLARTFSHSLEIDQGIGGQPVEIAIVLDQLVSHQLLDQLVAQSFDVHRTA